MNRLQFNQLNVAFGVIDLETTGLERSAEIIQLSCRSLQDQSSFNKYLLPETKSIKKAASKVHGISVEYRKGKKVLQKEGNILPAVEQQSGLNDFLEYVKAIADRPVVDVLLLSPTTVSILIFRSCLNLWREMARWEHFPQ